MGAEFQRLVTIAQRIIFVIKIIVKVWSEMGSAIEGLSMVSGKIRKIKQR